MIRTTLRTIWARKRRLASTAAPEPEFDRHRLIVRAAPIESRQKCRTIGDMNVLEQAVAKNGRRRTAEELLRGPRGKDHTSPLVVKRDHVVHILSQQAIAVLASLNRLL